MRRLATLALPEKRREVRLPSLESGGFVHLSTPDQVQLPAERLYPGRRDLALLVVDPARLTDPVRFEDGVPTDPGGMQFPHLYGPLPVSAVVAVVPYHGVVPEGAVAPDWSRLSAAVQGHYGEDDPACPPEAVSALEAALGEAGVSVEMFVYPPVEDAPRQAWIRTLEFLRKHLG